MATAPDAEARFHACLAETLKWEGGYSNDKYDPGGATMNGIIQKEYDAYRLRKGLAKQSVRNISAAERDEIYRTKYWDEVNGDRLPPGVDLQTFDFGVNAGPQRGIKCLQSALGVDPDGHMGEITERALAACDPIEIVSKMADYRRRYYRSLSTFWRFGRGWLTRVQECTDAAVAMAGANHAPVSLMSPVEYSDEQSATQGKADQPPPASTAATQTGKAAGVSGLAGNGAVGISVAKAAQTAYHADRGMDFMLFLITLASDPVFWIGLSVVSAACFAWLDRSKLLKREAV
ncbi:glycoside hydrolase family 108 protein [Hyphomicrobium sp. DY-1]|uniref:glycoside hydrolase family 108 protein n=1 Tax=Hyphomicrobium sp. DY-1 TaxID=3075650 RepID=UPI0039C2FFA1